MYRNLNFEIPKSKHHRAFSANDSNNDSNSQEEVKEKYQIQKKTRTFNLINLRSD
jgi:hypothetical protein